MILLDVVNVCEHFFRYAFRHRVDVVWVPSDHQSDVVHIRPCGTGGGEESGDGIMLYVSVHTLWEGRSVAGVSNGALNICDLFHGWV